MGLEGSLGTWAGYAMIWVAADARCITLCLTWHALYYSWKINAGLIFNRVATLIMTREVTLVKHW